MIPIFIGYDEREHEAAEVCMKSIRRYYPDADVRMLDVKSIPEYERSFSMEHGQLIDGVTGQPFSTMFAFSRFLVPYLMNYEGWAVFCDCDFLWRADYREMMRFSTPQDAVLCVHHDHTPDNLDKMDGIQQTRYWRKNWSSLVVWNCGHPSNERITPKEVNEMPGLWLHAFQWLDEGDIGQLPEEYNYLVGRNGYISPTHHYRVSTEIKAVHMTEGGPWFKGFENVPYGNEWRAYMPAGWKDPE